MWKRDGGSAAQKLGIGRLDRIHDATIP